MANNTNNNLVGEFTVAPEALVDKAKQINDSLSMISLFMKMIEDCFKSLEEGEIWQGPLAEKYCENARAFFERGASFSEGSTNNGYNTYSNNVRTYATTISNLLNDASKGYLSTDEAIERSISGENSSSETSQDAESNNQEATKSTTEPATEPATQPTTEPTTQSSTQVEEPTTVLETTTTAATTKKTTESSTTKNQNSDVRYEVPQGETYAKQVQSINSLSEEKNADGSYYYKASAIAYGGTDSSGKKWNTKTEEGTGLRYVEEDGEKYYCAAMGTVYGEAGDKVKVTTDTGQTFNVIITDSKSVKDAETVNVNGETYSQYHYWSPGVKDLVELNCEYSKIPANVRNMGSWHVLEQFSGNVVSIEPIN